jgi:hypothetical protein
MLGFMGWAGSIFCSAFGSSFYSHPVLFQQGEDGKGRGATIRWQDPHTPKGVVPISSIPDKPQTGLCIAISVLH